MRLFPGMAFLGALLGAPSTLASPPEAALAAPPRTAAVLPRRSGGGARDVAGAGVAGVAAWLRGPEDFPGETFWRARPPETADALLALTRSRSEARYVLLRAVTALQWFPSERTRNALTELIQTQGTHELLVREGLLTLARAFGAEATATLGPFVRDARPTVRDGAKRALALATEPAPRGATGRPAPRPRRRAPSQGTGTPPPRSGPEGR